MLKLSKTLILYTDVQLMYNTATGWTVNQELDTTVLLLLERTSGSRCPATTHRKSSVKVSNY